MSDDKVQIFNIMQTRFTPNIKKRLLPASSSTRLPERDRQTDTFKTHRVFSFFLLEVFIEDVPQFVSVLVSISNSLSHPPSTYFSPNVTP